RMRDIVRDAVAAGALGFATSKSPTHVGFSGRPVPSRAATQEEIQALCVAAAPGVVQTTIGPGLLFDELAEIVRATGRPLTWPALLWGMREKGAHRIFLGRVAAQRGGGRPIVPRVACRPLNFEFDLPEPFPLESLPPFGDVSKADRAGKIAIYRDP